MGGGRLFSLYTIAYVDPAIPSQVDKLERESFIAELRKAPPLSSTERIIIIRSLSYANYRWVEGQVEVNDQVRTFEKDGKFGWRRLQVSLIIAERDKSIISFCC